MPRHVQLGAGNRLCAGKVSGIMPFAKRGADCPAEHTRTGVPHGELPDCEVPMADFTERAIKASFLKLLNEQPLNKISVRMIVEDCGINRNSFYYHYQDIPTLLETIVTEYTDDLIRKYPTIASLSECFQVAFQFALENKRAVTHIYQSVSWDMFEREALRLCEYAVTAYVDSAFDAPMDETDRKILIRFISCELFGMCVSWISRGMDGGAIEELERMLQLCHGMSTAVIQRSQETKKA